MLAAFFSGIGRRVLKNVAETVNAVVSDDRAEGAHHLPHDLRQPIEVGCGGFRDRQRNHAEAGT
jgi:hypothetical protein